MFVGDVGYVSRIGVADFAIITKHVESVRDEVCDMMEGLSFIPNSPTLINAGDDLQQLSACFVDSPGDELVMGVRHREYPIECVQFHPESVLTACGREILENFLSRYTSTPAA